MKKIAITGGKGGTGKSTVATALAVELGKNNKILLVDADVDCPNDHLLLGIKRKKIETVFQRIPKWDSEKCVKCGKCSEACKTHAIVSVKNQNPVFVPLQCNGCGACVLSCPVNAISWDKKEIGFLYKGKGHGIDFLSGELKVKEPLSEFIVDALKENISKTENEFDYIVIDTSAGTHCDVISALQKCDFSFPVAEATPLGAHDLKLILRLIKELNIPSEIILNKSGVGKEELIEKVAEKYGKKITARIPYKKEIMLAYSKGIPVEDKSILKIKEMIEK